MRKYYSLTRRKFQFQKGSINTKENISSRGTFSDFNSKKVRLIPRFLRDTLTTRPYFNSKKVRLIQNNAQKAAKKVRDFNSKKVRLIRTFSRAANHSANDFNSKKVRLIRSRQLGSIAVLPFQFQKGSINTFYAVCKLLIAFTDFNSKKVRLIQKIWPGVTIATFHFNSKKVRLIHD